MVLTVKDQRVHKTGTNCHVCDKLLNGNSVQEHCQITGKYRGDDHNACKLKLQLNPKTTPIPVVFHNLREYNGHLLMQAISKVKGKIRCISNNSKKYISFPLGQLGYNDSYQFVLTSLDKLVTANKPDDFCITAAYQQDRQKQQLLLDKGIYPYEYMDAWDSSERYT